MEHGLDNAALVAASRVGVALAIGLLIGLERGWQSRALPEGARVAGVRTFGLIGLLGGALAVAVEGGGDLLLMGGFLALGALIALGYWQQVLARGDLSITTAVSALLTFALGALAGIGMLVPAAAGGVTVALLLGVKPELHAAMQRFDRAELLAGLRLLVISVVVLPLLPDQGYGPWQALNPYRLWWMVVIVAAISFSGYVAVRIAGERLGMTITAFLGGLTSSTAVAVSMAQRCRDQPSRRMLFAGAATFASAMMPPRLLVVIAVFSPAWSSWSGCRCARWLRSPRLGRFGKARALRQPRGRTRPIAPAIRSTCGWLSSSPLSWVSSCSRCAPPMPGMAMPGLTCSPRCRDSRCRRDHAFTRLHGAQRSHHSRFGGVVDLDRGRDQQRDEAGNRHVHCRGPDGTTFCLDSGLCTFLRHRGLADSNQIGFHLMDAIMTSLGNYNSAIQSCLVALQSKESIR